MAAALWTAVPQTGRGGQAAAAGEAGRSGDWCSWLGAVPGTLHGDPDNRWIRELRFFGRFHVNYAWVDGESAGRDFWYSNRGEIRRLWPGVTAKLADGAITAHYEAILGGDEKCLGGGREIGYTATWSAYLEWALNETFPGLGGGAWRAGYGKRCLPLAEEVLDSSKFMPVVERSAISNRLFILTSGGSSPLGAWVRHDAARWSSFAGIYSTDSAPEWGTWQDGVAGVIQTQRDISDRTGTDSALLAVALYYEDTRLGDDRFIGFDINWATSLWTIVGEGRWTIRANLILGESDPSPLLPAASRARRDGLFWGFVGTAQYWLVEDRLEAVGRYHYQGAENPQGVRLDSRYARAAGLPKNEDIPLPAGGYGDQQHSVYLGLNWLVCSHQLKLMSGFEWERMESDGSQVYEGITCWLGMRSFF